MTEKEAPFARNNFSYKISLNFVQIDIFIKLIFIYFFSNFEGGSCGNLSLSSLSSQMLGAKGRNKRKSRRKKTTSVGEGGGASASAREGGGHFFEHIFFSYFFLDIYIGI